MTQYQDEPSIVRRQRLDRYEVLAEIASGGMATVFVGRLNSAPGFERLVAIKKLHPHLEREREFVEMFLDEARIAARIHHPNVVSTLEFGQSERGFFLVMDYVEGTTLAKLLAKAAQTGVRVPQPVALRIVLDSLQGLHVAHDLTGEDGQPLDVVHRDVSPQNVLVGIDGTARITDFGVARAASRLAVTRTGQLKGKLGYMAPEQAKGEHTDRRADVFAMGIILWEALASRRLFKGRTETDAETLSRVLYADIPRVSTVVPDVPPLLDEAVARALERPLEKRFASCADFIDAIEEAAQQGARVASPREVARYMEEHFGRECAQRREALRRLAPAGPDGARTIEDIQTSADVPRLVSSVSSASMAVAEPSQSTGVSQVASVAPPAPKTSPVLLGALGLAMLVTTAAVATMVWVVTRSPSTSASTMAPAAPAASAVTSAPPPVAQNALVAPSTSASADPPAASASASPSATAPAKPVAPVVVPQGTGKATKTNTGPGGGGDGLSSNPYRR